MSVIKILEHNDRQLLKDLRECTEVMVYASATREFFKTFKSKVEKSAESNKITLYMSRDIYKVRRLVMVIV